MSGPERKPYQTLARDLFAVDVEAEITRLCKLRFKTPGEPVVELVSFAAGLEPDRIDLKLSRKRMSLVCTGSELSDRTVHALRVAFDSSRPPEIRHRSLVRIEQEGSLSLLAAFALESSRVFVEWTDSGVKKSVELSKRGTPRMTRPRSTGDFAVTVVGRRRSWQKEMETVRRRCRFAGFPIRLNGQRLDRGLRLRDCLLSKPFERSGLRGVVGVPLEGDFIQLVRLSNGIAVEETVRASASGLALSAVVEGKKRDLAPIVAAVESMGLGLYERLAEGFDGLGRTEKERVVELLMKLTKRTGDDVLLSSLKAFPRVDGPPLSLVQIRKAAASGTIWAVDSDIPISNYESSNRLVLRLDGEQRRFLEREARISLETPPPKVGGDALKPRLGVRIGLTLKRAGELLSGGPGRSIPDERLNESELAFVEAVRLRLDRSDFAFSMEEGPLRTTVSMASGQRRPLILLESPDGERRCLVSKSHPLVKAAMKACAKSDAYLFPALIALNGGKGFFGRGAQRS